MQEEFYDDEDFVAEGLAGAGEKETKDLDED